MDARRNVVGLAGFGRDFFKFQLQQSQDWSRVYGPGDDEEEFGSNHAERRGQHACALGRSIAVHFSYNTWLGFQHFWTKSDSTFFQRSATGRDLDIYHLSLFFSEI